MRTAALLTLPWAATSRLTYKPRDFFPLSLPERLGRAEVEDWCEGGVPGAIQKTITRLLTRRFKVSQVTALRDAYFTYRESESRHNVRPAEEIVMHGMSWWVQAETANLSSRQARRDLDDEAARNRVASEMGDIKRLAAKRRESLRQRDQRLEDNGILSLTKLLPVIKDILNLPETSKAGPKLSAFTDKLCTLYDAETTVEELQDDTPFICAVLDTLQSTLACSAPRVVAKQICHEVSLPVQLDKLPVNLTCSVSRATTQYHGGLTNFIWDDPSLVLDVSLRRFPDHVPAIIPESVRDAEVLTYLALYRALMILNKVQNYAWSPTCPHINPYKGLELLPGWNATLVLAVTQSVTSAMSLRHDSPLRASDIKRPSWWLPVTPALTPYSGPLNGSLFTLPLRPQSLLSMPFKMSQLLEGGGSQSWTRSASLLNPPFFLLFAMVVAVFTPSLDVAYQISEEVWDHFWTEDAKALIDVAAHDLWGILSDPAVAASTIKDVRNIIADVLFGAPSNQLDELSINWLWELWMTSDKDLLALAAEEMLRHIKKVKAGLSDQEAMSVPTLVISVQRDNACKVAIALRGTSSFHEWILDFNYWASADATNGKIHRGVQDFVSTFYPITREWILHHAKKHGCSCEDLDVIFYGHSLGGGVAQQLALKLAVDTQQCGLRVSDVVFAPMKQLDTATRQIYMKRVNGRTLIDLNDPLAWVPCHTGNSRMGHPRCSRGHVGFPGQGSDQFADHTGVVFLDVDYDNFPPFWYAYGEQGLADTHVVGEGVSHHFVTSLMTSVLPAKLQQRLPAVETVTAAHVCSHACALSAACLQDQPTEFRWWCELCPVLGSTTH